MFTHDDDRRTLIEWASDSFKVAKAVIAKPGGCVVGMHHHLNKDEHFLLFSGFASHVVIGNKHWKNVAAPYEFDVPRGTYHAFELDGGSVLLGVGTEPFDPADEIAGKP